MKSSLLPKHECPNYQNVRTEDCQNSEQAKNLLLHFPAFAVFQPLEEEVLEGVQGRLSGKTIINGLVVFVRFEPEFVGVGKE